MLVFEINITFSMINNTIISTTNNNLFQAVPNICAITQHDLRPTQLQSNWRGGILHMWKSRLETLHINIIYNFDEILFKIEALNKQINVSVK